MHETWLDADGPAVELVVLSVAPSEEEGHRPRCRSDLHTDLSIRVGSKMDPGGSSLSSSQRLVPLYGLLVQGCGLFGLVVLVRQAPAICLDQYFVEWHGRYQDRLSGLGPRQSYRDLKMVDVLEIDFAHPPRKADGSSDTQRVIERERVGKTGDLGCQLRWGFERFEFLEELDILADIVVQKLLTQCIAFAVIFECLLKVS